MRKVFAISIFLAFAQEAVPAALAATSTVSGATALALAAVVADYSSVLSAQERRAVARLFNDDVNFGFPAYQKISVKADAVVCRISNVDIAERSCELTFGKQRRTVKGRQANELDATAEAAGVASEGAAGTIFTSLSHLACTLDPHEIEQKAGGGASCTFDTGQ
jgi:hypothetical protein